MFIEFYNEKQAMDILNYATEKDYDFETGDTAWEVSYIQDIKEELDYQLYECNDDDPDVIHFNRYSKKEQEKIYDYVVKNVLQAICESNMSEYYNEIYTAIWDSMRNYFNEHPLDKKQGEIL